MSASTAPIAAALATVNAAIAAAKSLSVATPLTLASVYVAMVAAEPAFNTAILADDAAIDMTNIGSVIPFAPVISASALFNQQATVAQEANLIIAESFLIRASANIAGAIGPGAFAPGTLFAPAPPAVLPAPQSPTLPSAPFILGQSVLGGPNELG